MAGLEALKMVQLPWDAEALEAFAPSVQAGAWAAVDDHASALGGAQLWQYKDGPVDVLLAIRPVRTNQGLVCDVVGMRSLGQRVPAVEFGRAMDDLAKHAYGADMLSMSTRHPHMVRGCVRAGWTAVATVVVKPLKVH